MFFFFQAEDGIRDLTVTGVQTCALPISRGRGHRWRQGGGGRRAGEAREAARRRRPAADPPRPVRVPRGGARPVGATRPSGGGGGALRGGRRGKTAARATRRAAAGGPVAPVRGEGPADQEGAERDREAEGRLIHRRLRAFSSCICPV